jgi:SAM-dependent methyltransferase
MSDHRLAIEATKAALLRAGVSATDIAVFDGTITSVHQEQERQRFQNGHARVFLGTRQAAGVSIELTRADAIIFLNTPWTPSAFDQAVDRIHRQDDQGRHAPGKAISVYNLNLDVPLSIDALKALVVRRKRAFGEMLVNGNLTPEILDAFAAAQEGPATAIREGVQSKEAPLTYERRLFEEFHILLDAVFKTNDHAKKMKLWEQISSVYHLILGYKSTYFANRASLDHLSHFADLHGRSLRVLDLGLGPSTLYHAYQQDRERLNQNGLTMQVFDYDASPAMLSRGARRQGEQMVGSFSLLDKAFPPESFDLVNMSYSFRFAEHPAKLIKTIHSLLRNKGLFVLILPKKTVVPPRFCAALETAGFRIRTAPGSTLESKLPDNNFSELVREFGEEFARDIRKTAETTHTYLLAERLSGAVVTRDDEDFRLGYRTENVDTEKIRRLRSTTGRFHIVPANLVIESEVEAPTIEQVFEEHVENRVPLDIQKHISALERLSGTLAGQSLGSSRRPKIERQLRREYLKLEKQIQLSLLGNSDLSPVFRRQMERGLQHKHLNQWVRGGGADYMRLIDSLAME